MEYREQIKTYVVRYYAGGDNAEWVRATILLSRADNSVLGLAFFYRTTEYLPATDNRRPADGYVQCYFPPSEFPNVLDLLRNESPLYLVYDGNTNRAYFSTSMEPIGDGEASGSRVRVRI